MSETQPTVVTTARAPLAVVTMVYDEYEHLGIWTRHYAREVGAANCTVIDHGSDPALMAAWSAGDGAGVNHLRIPRSPQDDTRRTAFISAFCAALLGYYEAVIYCDCDELVVADPARYASLADYARQSAQGAERAEIVTATGYEVIQRADEEAPFDWSGRVGVQRRWLRFSSALCKPVLIRRPVRWEPGFHCTDAPPIFEPLSLFHLRYADEASGLARLARTRAQPWADAQAGSHQRMDDAAWVNMMRGMAGLPGDNARTLDANDPELAHWHDEVRASDAAGGVGSYRYALDLSPMALWALPERYRSRF